MKKAKYIFLLLWVIVLIPVSIYLIFQTNILGDNQFCKKANNLQTINACINSDMKYQDKYDMFYNYASKTNDETFTGGFLTAYNDCQSHNKECHLHDVNVFLNLQTRCALAGNLSCSQNILSDMANPKVNDENIKIFNNTILKSIQLKYHNPCDNYYSFFKKLNRKQKNQLAPEVSNTCNNAILSYHLAY